MRERIIEVALEGKAFLDGQLEALSCPRLEGEG
jgi:hypothetical protein